jgi:hypothetical protein
MLAQKFARAVYDRLNRTVACDTKTFCQRSGRGAEEPEAVLATEGGTSKRRSNVLDVLRRCTPRGLEVPIP